MIRSTYTYAILEVSHAAVQLIKALVVEPQETHDVEHGCLQLVLTCLQLVLTSREGIDADTNLSD